MKKNVKGLIARKLYWLIVQAYSDEVFFKKKKEHKKWNKMEKKHDK